MRSLKYAIVLDFGYTKDPEDAPSTIYDLAEATMKNFLSDEEVIVLAQTETYMRLHLDGFPTHRLLHIDVGQASTNGTSGGGTYHVLRRAKGLIINHELKNSGRIPAFPMVVLLVAHQLHVPRAVKQGELFGLTLVKAHGLPSKLYSVAEQWWCRKKLLWYLREIAEYPMLKLTRQI